MYPPSPEVAVPRDELPERRRLRSAQFLFERGGCGSATDSAQRTNISQIGPKAMLSMSCSACAAAPARKLRGRVRLARRPRVPEWFSCVSSLGVRIAPRPPVPEWFSCVSSLGVRIAPRPPVPEWFSCVSSLEARGGREQPDGMEQDLCHQVAPRVQVVECRVLGKLDRMRRLLEDSIVGGRVVVDVHHT